MSFVVVNGFVVGLLNVVRQLLVFVALLEMVANFLERDEMSDSFQAIWLCELETHGHSVQANFAQSRRWRHRQRFDVVVGWIVLDWTRPAGRLEKTASFRRIAQERQTALGQHAVAVEHLKELTGRLMNGADDGLALACEVFHAIDQHHGHVGVEARRGLVTEQDGRVGENLGRKGQATSLSAADAFDAAVWTSDFRVFTFFQVELKTPNKICK